MQQVDGTTTEGAAAVDGAAVVTALGWLPIAGYEYTADPANRKRLGPRRRTSTPPSAWGPAPTSRRRTSRAWRWLPRSSSRCRWRASKGRPARSGRRATRPRRGRRGRAEQAFDDAVTKLGGLERSDRRLRKRNRSCAPDREARAPAPAAAAGRVTGMRRSIAAAATGALTVAVLAAAPAAADEVVADDLVVPAAMHGPRLRQRRAVRVRHVAHEGEQHPDRVRRHQRGPRARERLGDHRERLRVRWDELPPGARPTTGRPALRVFGGAPTGALTLTAGGAFHGRGALTQREDGTFDRAARGGRRERRARALATLPITRYRLTADPAGLLRVGPAGAASTPRSASARAATSRRATWPGWRSPRSRRSRRAWPRPPRARPGPRVPRGPLGDPGAPASSDPAFERRPPAPRSRRSTSGSHGSTGASRGWRGARRRSGSGSDGSARTSRTPVLISAQVQPRVRVEPAADLRARLAVDDHDIGRVVVRASDQRRADAVGVNRHAVALERADPLGVEASGHDDADVATRLVELGAP